VFCALVLCVVSAWARAGEGVILLHGLCRTERSMRPMEVALRGAGYEVLNVDYPSRTATAEELAGSVVPAALANPQLKGCARVHFVTHSMGGILVRAYFASHKEPRLGRVVMLGPPNQGSEVVDSFGDWWLFRKLNGPAGGGLGTGVEEGPSRLGAVRFELGVIAGDRSINWINSLLIPGPDDGKVSVERTHVAGERQHLVMHVSHPFLMSDKAVIARGLSFLKTGAF